MNNGDVFLVVLIAIGCFLFYLGSAMGIKTGMEKLHKGEYICKTIEFTGDIECKENKDER